MTAGASTVEICAPTIARGVHDRGGVRVWSPRLKPSEIRAAIEEGFRGPSSKPQPVKNTRDAEAAREAPEDHFEFALRSSLELSPRTLETLDPSAVYDYVALEVFDQPGQMTMRIRKQAENSTQDGHVIVGRAMPAFCAGELRVKPIPQPDGTVLFELEFNTRSGTYWFPPEALRHAAAWVADQNLPVSKVHVYHRIPGLAPFEFTIGN